MVRFKLLSHSLEPIFTNKLSVLNPSGHCYACGNDERWRYAKVINDDLTNTWSINDTIRNSFNARESMFCPKCECSFRLRQLAECITYVYGGSSLLEIMADKSFSEMQIAEINSCGKLHNILYRHPNLKYSEFNSKENHIRSEDLEKLSYDNMSFDLVLTSDTLEHVPDITKALTEIRRILKPGGKHIFTVPIVWSRKTRNRTNLEPSYHGAGEPDYLVFNEFGHDMIDTIKATGFSVKIFKANIFNLNDSAGVIIATRIGD